VIIDLDRFLGEERPRWDELGRLLDRIERMGMEDLALRDARRLHYLYERTGSDLVKIKTAAADPKLAAHLESLLARAYAQIHGRRRRATRIRPIHWLVRTLPRTVRRRWRAGALSVSVTLAGVLLGIILLQVNPDAKRTLLPFGHGEMDPSERVAEEEAASEDLAEQDTASETRSIAGREGAFSAKLMANNISVSARAMALGVTYGIGTLAMLFYNGAILGGICLDYVQAGEAEFLAGWLLPHGSIEIPAIMLAGQAGLVLGGALIGWGDRTPLAGRLREVMPDLLTMLLGVVILLVWAGIIEAFFSQYHEPFLPYWVKICFGLVELLALVAWFGLVGRGGEEAA
jgi:uncharacterized membrane protein SpoIIM required for sporulation